MRNIISLVFIIFSLQTQAQVVSDALRYSLLEVGGTARSVGVGGAIGALGADYSTLSTNPAGLATFRRGEFVLTPTIYNTKTVSLLERGEGNAPNTESIANFGFNNIGVVLNNRPARSSWKTFNLGIGYNRLASFNQEFVLEGKSQGSIVDRFAEVANDGIYDEFEVKLADDVVAIYNDDNGTPNDDSDDFYTNDFQDAGTSPDYQLNREQFVKTKGSYGEMVIAVAGNYDEKLMVGATLGIPFINYSEEKTYKESELEGVDDVTYFNNLTFRETVETSGTGVNLKIGAIYRINQMFRAGVAIHTPTAFKLDDNFDTELTYDYTDGNGNSKTTATSPDGNFKYKLKTPWRVMGNVAVLINRKGFISADVEYVDYSVAAFNLTSNSSSSDDKDYEVDLNREIGKQYQSALNIRLGGEYALNKLRFRAGYTISGTPYADTDITNNTYSLGFGVREKKFYLDLAYKYAAYTEGYVPYILSDPKLEQFTTNEVSKSQFLMTVGFKF
ncbi:MAG TPA: hypothetical protein ENJ53_00365 [Phaeodactylibacter sp.]|nr:hypothetical protein [Phaeodactylibacter sp.]